MGLIFVCINSNTFSCLHTVLTNKFMFPPQKIYLRPSYAINTDSFILIHFICSDVCTWGCYFRNKRKMILGALKQYQSASLWEHLGTTCLFILRNNEPQSDVDSSDDSRVVKKWSKVIDFSQIIPEHKWSTCYVQSFSYSFVCSINVFCEFIWQHCISNFDYIYIV